MEPLHIYHQLFLNTAAAVRTKGSGGGGGELRGVQVEHILQQLL